VTARSAFIFAWVLPEHRRAGIGGGLLDRLTAFARSKGIERMATLVYEDDADAIEFVLGRGLEIDGGGQLGSLDLATAPDIPSNPIDGITIVSLADRPDLEEALYTLDVLVRPEIPMIAHEPLPTFLTWQEAGPRDPGYLPGLTLLALDGERLVGGIQLYDNGEDVAFIGMISVHPDARRRGIARVLKLELARRAREAGLRAIETYNDGTNERIRGLNESLGYVYDRPYVALRGPLPGPSEADPSREIQRL
jgi:GNAT superfamily N-acetyltransferase